MQTPHALALVTRALQPESVHAGVVVIARADGTLLGVVGDRTRYIFPRSAIKILQAVPLIETGAADRFAFTGEELALACASHRGTSRHVACARGIIERLGLGKGALVCGAHEPLGDEPRRDLIRRCEAPNALHNNCSGKHAGMLATAVHMGEPVADYDLVDHPVQRRIRDVLRAMTEDDLKGVVPGVDGCSAPNWPLHIERLAVAFARIVSGRGLPPQRAKTFERLLQACWANPEAMAGVGHLDTQMLSRFPGDVFIKTGAEGVYCGGIRSLGIGFALKADDGATRASETAVRAILARFIPEAADLAEPQILQNAAGISVGDVRTGDGLASVLGRISA